VFLTEDNIFRICENKSHRRICLLGYKSKKKSLNSFLIGILGSTFKARVFCNDTNCSILDVNVMEEADTSSLMM